MKKLFFLILLLGAFFGAQVVYFQNFAKSEKVLDKIEKIETFQKIIIEKNETKSNENKPFKKDFKKRKFKKRKFFKKKTK